MNRRCFLTDDEGQDLIEYVLLLAVICLASAGMLSGWDARLSPIWEGAKSALTQAQGS